MATLRIDGIDFNGEDFEIKNNILFVDGNGLWDFTNNIRMVAESGNITTTKNVIIQGRFTGNIKAGSVVINTEEMKDCSIQADRVILSCTNAENCNYFGSVLKN